MKIICDTHALLFWADRRDRLSAQAFAAIENGRSTRSLACADISLWEIAILFRKRHLRLPRGLAPADYVDSIIQALALNVLPITPAIAELAESGITAHGDPADRLIAATAIVTESPLVTIDEKLHALPRLRCIW